MRQKNTTNQDLPAESMRTASRLHGRHIKHERTTPASVKAGWRRIGWLLFIYALVGSGIAIFSPERILDESSSVRALGLAVSQSIAPAITKYAHISAIPQVTTVYLTLMILLMPVVVFTAIASMPLVDYANFDWNETQSTNAKNYKYFLGPILLAILAWGLVAGISDFSAVDGRAHAFRSLMLGSRIGLVVFGGFGMACLSLVALMLALLLVTPITVLLSRKFGRKKKIPIDHRN